MLRRDLPVESLPDVREEAEVCRRGKLEVLPLAVEVQQEQLREGGEEAGRGGVVEQVAEELVAHVGVLSHF